MTRRAAVHAACIAALVAATLAVYAPCAAFDFVHWDDPLYVRDNPHVQRGLTLDGARWAMTTGEAANWHPVTWLSLMTDATLFGMRPGAFHMTNVLLHALAATLLYLALARMTGRPLASAIVAGVFALHPLHVESVAWVSQRKDVLAAVFAHAALCAYAAYAARPTAVRYAAVTLLLTLGLMSKPTLVTLPAALLLLDYWPLRRLRLRLRPPLPPGEGRGEGISKRSKTAIAVSATETDASGERKRQDAPPFSRDAQRSAPPDAPPDAPRVPPHAPRAGPLFVLLEKLPWFALAAVVSIVTYRVQAAGGATRMQPLIDLPARIANAAVAYVQYLAKTAWPVDLTYLYTHPALPGGTPLTAAQVIVAVIVLAAITLAALAARRGPLIVGWLWFLGMLVPMIGLVQVGRQAYADRYTYLPLTGLFIMLVFGAGALLQRIPAHRHNADRARHEPRPSGSGPHPSPETAPSRSRLVMQPDTRNEAPPANPRARTLIAGLASAAVLLACALLSLQQVRHWRDAQSLVEHALRITPNDPVVLQAYGSIQQAQGDRPAAIAAFERAVRIDPGFAEAHNSLGVALQLSGRLDEAIARYREAVRADPAHIRARYHLGRALLQLPGDRAARHAAEAVTHLRLAADTRAATSLDTRLLADIEHNLGDALWRLGRLDEAAAAYRRSLTHHPESPEVRAKLARLTGPE